MIVKLQVRHQRIQGARQIPRLVVESSRRHVYLDLDFDEEWDGLTKTVIFSNGSESTEVSWEGKPVEVPVDVLIDGTLRIACVGIGNGGLYLKTKYMPEGIRIHRSGRYRA